QLLKEPLVAIEHGIERCRIAGEIRTHKLLERGGIAILRAPVFGHLEKSPLDSRLLRLAIFRGELCFQLCGGAFHPLGRSLDLSDVGHGRLLGTDWRCHYTANNKCKKDSTQGSTSSPVISWRQFTANERLAGACTVVSMVTRILLQIASRACLSLRGLSLSRQGHTITPCAGSAHETHTL